MKQLLEAAAVAEKESEAVMAECEEEDAPPYAVGGFLGPRRAMGYSTYDAPTELACGPAGDLDTSIK